MIEVKLYFYGFIACFKKFILRKNTGTVILSFVKKMGVVYIKFAQMLAMQNFGNLFTEEDRICLSSICDHVNPISFKKIKKQIEKEYGCSLENKFKKVYEEPIGSASISQVHKAILKDGKIVAIKVKRKDVTKKIDHDIKQIRKFIHRFGRFVKFRNYLGGDAALDLYLKWIKEETDFENEKKNILKYYHFAKSVNGKIPGVKDIVVPRVYKKMCTKNIIVMEFIFSKTINQMELTNKNKEKIKNSINDYVALSFYALFHDIPVVFHGDPHGGNIYIENNGNIGFLDMGLIFSLSKEEVKFVRELFLNAYTCNIDYLYHLIVDTASQQGVNEYELKLEIEKCCRDFKNISVATYFCNMIFVFTKFNVNPSPVFYKMAKAFVALGGIDTFLKNNTSTEKLLSQMIVEFYVNRTMTDIQEITQEGIQFLPNFIKNALDNGLTKSITDQIMTISSLHKKMKNTINHIDEIINIFNTDIS